MLEQPCSPPWRGWCPGPRLSSRSSPWTCMTVISITVRRKLAWTTRNTLKVARISLSSGILQTAATHRVRACRQSRERHGQGTRPRWPARWKQRLATRIIGQCTSWPVKLLPRSSRSSLGAGGQATCPDTSTLTSSTTSSDFTGCRYATNTHPPRPGVHADRALTTVMSALRWRHRATTTPCGRVMPARPNWIAEPLPRRNAT